MIRRLFYTLNPIIVVGAMMFLSVEDDTMHSDNPGHAGRGAHDQESYVKVDGASAHWVRSDRLIWDVPDHTERIELRYCLNAAIRIDFGIPTGGNSIPVGERSRLDEKLADQHRHISGRSVWEMDAPPDTIKKAMRGQLRALAFNGDGRLVAATRVQFPGLIDEFFYYDGKLGPAYDGDKIILSLWAPTARSVRLKMHDREKKHLDTIDPDHWSDDAAEDAGDAIGDDQTNGMKGGSGSGAVELLPPTDGVWRFTGSRDDWDRMFYRFEVVVYHNGNNQVNTFEVTDPYSVSLSIDSYFSQFADLAGDEDLKPDGWDELRKKQPKPTDITLYEAHVRDFSMRDHTVAKEHRGTFMAFTYNGEQGRELSDGMAHLKRLSEAGLTHLHLLPINDIATVFENPDRRIDLHHPYRRICQMINHPGLMEECERRGFEPIWEVFGQMAAEDPATHLIQKPMHLPGRTRGMAALDAYNWGYDPFHFNVPEGSYSTNPDGVQRIIELRKMVQALHQIGLHVVVDVVYNHTFASHLAQRFSVLNRIVPFYYHRHNPDTGQIEQSTCCENTAAEHRMMEKLIIDSILLWAKEYKIDSFRFDLMGHHPLYVMENVKKALADLTLEKDGVDGRGIYIYGEGWNFGEVADNRIFDQATQFNMTGKGIGNFNDRLRDAVRGGNFTDHGRRQGFSSGLYLFPNEEADWDQEKSRSQLLEAADRIRVGMTGNLVSYPYINRYGERVTGSNEWIGFAGQPHESVNYIDKHDNETLWDNTQAKLPLDMKMKDRVRVHLLSNAFVNFGQGVPFYQMGTDILRSKSMDRNSFDSGDWFNAVDFSLETHNWAIGLPPGWDNEARWDQIRTFLRHPNMEVGREHMEWAHQAFLEQLQIRYSSPLFRLTSAEEIHRRVAFHNVGPAQEPGIIVMTISDGLCAGDDLDPDLDGILILFNADIRKRTISLAAEGVNRVDTRLHPIQARGSDYRAQEAVRDGDLFHLPPLTAVVYITPQDGEQGRYFCNDLSAE